ncbi:transmembrane protein 54b isoform X2 [Labrus mixtus]|uniref:transmembrane protein 54b isoform X2 n=1 Tax=Labrus mixtus TaxID=508554 RepID=UPI0029C028D7|nr:transmembrane protein 54b isoform X2 [Labrus mixtus]
MANKGVCCANLEDSNALMKMGLSMVLIGHVNFLLGALVHGVVLRPISLHKQARVIEYAISNVVALTSGLVTWTLFTVSLTAALMAAASAIGLTISVVRAIIHGGRSLLTHCRFPDAIGYSSITNECPFDPTRIYSTTLILWVPLIVTCVIQMVFSSRTFAACISFLNLPCCHRRKTTRDYGRAINIVRPMEEAPLSHYTEPPRSYTETPIIYNEPPRSYTETPARYTETPRCYREPPRRITDPPRQKQRPPQPPQHPPRLHQSLPPSDRRHRAAEQHQRLDRGSLERSSFWI